MTVGIDYGRLRRIREDILADPEHFSMVDWVSERGNATCIGGRAALDAGYITLRQSVSASNRFYDVTEAGAAIGGGRQGDDEARFRVALNLTREEADRLFNVDQWPQPLYVEYAMARSPEARADVAARRIDLFIKTRGHE